MDLFLVEVGEMIRGLEHRIHLEVEVEVVVTCKRWKIEELEKDRNVLEDDQNSGHKDLNMD
jgi:hypothetical protein